MIDLNPHGASQKEKTFFRQDNRIDRIFKKIVLDIGDSDLFTLRVHRFSH